MAVEELRWTVVETVRPRRLWVRAAPSNGHTAEVLHAEHGGRYPFNWRCSCRGTGRPVQTKQDARRQAQKHVNHPDRR